jgi:hypothetical protein
MPVVLLRTASKHVQTGFQVARQRLSDTLGERIVTRVSSFDTTSSTASPKPLADNGLPPTIIETAIREDDSMKDGNTSTHESANKSAENTLLSPYRVDRAASLSHLLSPIRLSSLFRGKDSESPQSRPMIITRSDSDYRNRSSNAFMQLFAQGRSRSSESLASDDAIMESTSLSVGLLPRLPFLERKQAPIFPKPVHLSDKSDDHTSETNSITSLKRPADPME